MSKIIGIDLGTTNSRVAVIESGNPVIITNAYGARFTPSVVAVTRAGEWLTGELAQRQFVTNTENTVSSFKQYMGTDHRITLGEKKYFPQEISALMLQRLKMDAENYLGEQVTGAVITVPAYFNDAQRQATRDAGRIAGLDVKRVLSAPSAVSLTYEMGGEKKQYIIVYDLGGGTFSVAVIEIGDGIIKVLSTAGDNSLGGNDFDQRIVDYMLAELRRDGVDLSKDKAAVRRLKEAAECAKKELSYATVANISLPFLTMTEVGPKYFSINLTREKFNEITGDLVERTTVLVNMVLKDAGIAADDISKVLLVGGSTRIPSVQEKIKSLIGEEVKKILYSEESAAVGAAIWGELGGDVKGILLRDVVPLSISIEMMGGFVTRLIKRNTALPVRKSQIFSTSSDNQNGIIIHVVQGEEEIARGNATLGWFRINGIQQLEVMFEIDEDGMIDIYAKDLGMDKEQNISIPTNVYMSDDQIERAIRDLGDISVRTPKIEVIKLCCIIKNTGTGKDDNMSENKELYSTIHEENKKPDMKCAVCRAGIEMGRGKCPVCGFPVLWKMEEGEKARQQSEELAEQYRKKKLAETVVGFVEHTYEGENGKLTFQKSEEKPIMACKDMQFGETYWYSEEYPRISGEEIAVEVFVRRTENEVTNYTLKLKQPDTEKSWKVGVCLLDGFQIKFLVGNEEAVSELDVLSIL